MINCESIYIKSDLVINDEGFTVGGRAVGDEFMRDMNNQFFTDGHFIEPANSLQIMATTGMTVKVTPGWGVVAGDPFRITVLNDNNLAVEPSSPLSARVDRIVAQ